MTLIDWRGLIVSDTHEEELGPFWLGPNWHYGAWEDCEDGTRRIPVLAEDGEGKRHVGYVRELPAKQNACSTFVAESLEGRRIAPVRPTGPKHSLADLKTYLKL